MPFAGAAHVLGALLAGTVGMPLPRFAEERLFGPLGIAEHRWPTDPDGNGLGYGHLELRPRDVVRLGELYLDGGRGLLPESFATAATTARSAVAGPRTSPTATSGGSRKREDGRRSSRAATAASTRRSCRSSSSSS